MTIDMQHEGEHFTVKIQVLTKTTPAHGMLTKDRGWRDYGRRSAADFVTMLEAALRDVSSGA